MTDIQAAMGREQLKRMPAMVKRRRLLSNRYTELLRDIPGVRLPNEPDWARSNWQSYSVGIPAGCDQRRVMQHMLDIDIATRRGIMCAHLESSYSAVPWSCGVNADSHNHALGRCARLKYSEEAQDRSILLPLYHEMTEANQSSVVAAFLGACEMAPGRSAVGDRL
jgi:dTDP-4-amino-4,6-dideoxygalactose transaminase